MDWDQLFEDLKESFPIYASILSAILSIGAFVLTLNFVSLVLTLAISVIATALMSAAILWTARRKALSRRLQDFVVLKSDDVCELLDPEGREAIYKRRLTFRVNKPSPLFVTYPADVEGEQCEYKAYQSNNPETNFDIRLQRSGGRRVLFINLGRTLRKNEIIEDLWVEWVAKNSFVSQDEAVTVTSEPGQQNSTIKVILPSECHLHSSEWFVTYGRNPTPIQNGNIEVERYDSKSILFHDFSSFLKTTIELRLTISWRFSRVSNQS